ncbi:MAG: YhgE/Pip family protein [Sarcina sp.]
MEKQKKKLNGKTLWLISILVGVLLIPSFYSFMYLKSYWNNGTAINKVPIAVVNLDTPYSKDGKSYDIGQSIINNLKTNKTLNWQFVDYNQGKSGVYGTKYYAMIVIPKDFSEEIANATTDGFKKPKIDFYQNQGKNFVFSEISGSAAQTISTTVAQSISKSVSNVLVQTIYQTKDGFKSAASGATELQSGINKLETGSSSLNNGMTKLEGGTTKLANGVDKLQNGSTELVSGVDKLQNGSSTLSNGVSALAQGSEKLTNGVTKLQNGSSSLVTGMNKLSGGANALQSGVSKLQNGASNLSNGIEKLEAGSSSLAQGQAGITEELQELNQLISKGDTTAAQSLSAKIAAQSNALKEGMYSLNSGLSTAGNGANSISSGLGSLGTGVNSLSTGIASATNGASALNSGINTVSTGMRSLNSGLGTASVGAKAITSGLSSVGTGASALNSGLNSTSTGVSSLSNGLTSAKSGATELTTGLQSANSGANKLTSGLNSGYNTLNQNVTFTAEQMSNFISNPVNLNTIVINPVSSYGEGFTPYFSCIGLWVGAMYTYFVVSALSRKFKGSFAKRFTRMYLIGTVLCILQGLLMSVIIRYGLGLHPTNTAWFYIVNILTAVAIYSFMNGLHYIITPIMKAALMVFMVLEFTSCGGSYPIVMLPSFFKFVSHFGILTYSVSSMRMAISGIDYSVFYCDLFIIVLILIFSVIIGFLVGYLRNHITHKRVLRQQSEFIGKEETFNPYV